MMDGAGGNHGCDVFQLLLSIDVALIVLKTAKPSDHRKILTALRPSQIHSEILRRLPPFC
jgi:hypothetical protein